MIDPRAQSDSGKAENRLVSEHGPQVLIRLWAMIRTARTHDTSNQTFQRQLQECLTSLQRAMEGEPELTIAAVADYFYLNGVRVRVHSSLLSLYHALMAEFERRQLGAIRIQHGVVATELERFARVFLASEDPSVAERMHEVLEEEGIKHIQAVEATEIETEDLERPLDQRTKTSESGKAKRVFWRAVLGTRKIMLRASQTGRPDLRHAKRLVQPVVDNIMNHEFSIVGLTALKDHDEYTYTHCVNVSILAMSMGYYLGFSRQVLADLGVAALVHDIGKTTVPKEVLGKPSALTPEEWKLMCAHPIEGVRMITKMPGLSSLSVRAMRSCLEHHMNFDSSGYPKVGGEWRQATLSRIVALADCFDAMTGNRAYRRRAFSAFEALTYALGSNRKNFDPAVLWALIKTVGLYPPGSVLQTDSGHVVVSMSPNPDDLRRPHCRVMVNPNGKREPHDGAIWNPMPPSERVARVIPPEEQVISTTEYLAA